MIKTELKSDSPRKMKVAGTSHSFNDIADTDGVRISTQNMNKVHVDKDKMEVTFGAGITYTKLIEALVANDVAIPNVPSLPHLNVVGSVMTGTHGSGVLNQSMATYVK